MFYLTTHSTHFIYGYMASDIWLRTILIVREETRCRHIGYSYRLTARVLLYAPSHRQDNTYHCLCYTSHGELAGTRNSPMKDRSDDPPHYERMLYLWATSRSPHLYGGRTNSVGGWVSVKKQPLCAPYVTSTILVIFRACNMPLSIKTCIWWMGSESHPSLHAQVVHGGDTHWARGKEGNVFI